MTIKDVHESIVTLNELTDEDIQRPDLTGYTEHKADYGDEIIIIDRE